MDNKSFLNLDDINEKKHAKTLILSITTKFDSVRYYLSIQ